MLNQDEKERVDRRVIRRNTALDAGFVPNNQGLTGKERSWLYETCKDEEAEMIKCLEIMHEIFD